MSLALRWQDNPLAWTYTTMHTLHRTGPAKLVSNHAGQLPERNVVFIEPDSGIRFALAACADPSVAPREPVVVKATQDASAETLSRDRLLDAVWGYENYPNTRTVDTHIVHLRQKLEPNPEEPRFILTVHGSGYKFVG